MFRRYFLSFLFLMIGAFGPSAAVHAERIDHGAHYRACMDEVSKNPKKAFTAALRWHDLGGGEAAEHCAARALIGLEQYREGAARMEKLALGSRQIPAMKVQILSQAGQAWLLAGNAARAEAVATTAIKLLAEDDSLIPELLTDRAQARAQRHDFEGALSDLDASIITRPTNADAFAFRASTKRFLDDLSGAMRDAHSALNIDSAHPDALLERGILYRLGENNAAAREDWLMILSLAPDSQAANAARTNLEKMDVRKN